MSEVIHPLLIRGKRERLESARNVLHCVKLNYVADKLTFAKSHLVNSLSFRLDVRKLIIFRLSLNSLVEFPEDKSKMPRIKRQLVIQASEYSIAS